MTDLVATVQRVLASIRTRLLLTIVVVLALGLGATAIGTRLVLMARVDELVARVRTRLRDAGTTEVTTLSAADAELDLRTRRISVAGRQEDLTTREFALAELLFRHPGQVLSREQILSAVWGFDHDPGSNVVDVYVGYLRRKLGTDAIETVRGVGYRLVRDGVTGPGSP